MSVSVTMPRLGESVTEGTVTRWLKKEGERVEADEPLLEVSTDKVDTEIPSPVGGVLKGIKVGEDETVEVGSELAVIDDGAGGGEESGGDEAPAQEDKEQAKQEDPEPEPEPEPEPQAEQEQPEPEPERQEEPQGEAAAPAEQREQVADDESEDSDDEGGSGPSYVTPLVRRLASEHGVDLADVHGTGVGGRIRKQDVIDAAGKSGGAPQKQEQKQKTPAQAPAAQQQEPKPKPATAAAEEPTRSTADTGIRGRTEKLSRLRTVIAQRMVESLQISAQLTTVVEVDLTRIARLREQAKADF